jgi:hypothetical protein
MLNIGSATDCYQPVERELKLTRSVIEVLRRRATRFRSSPSPAAWSATWTCWRPLAAQRLAAVYVTITTLDPRWPAAWSRAPPRRTGACAPSARWPMRACPWA